MSKTLTGIVTSTKMDKTVIVRIENKMRHPVYKKVITRHRKFKVHNVLPNVNEGDVVVIQETIPVSKEKHFIVIEKVTKDQ